MTRARMPRPQEIDAARRDPRLLRAVAERQEDGVWRTRGVCQSVDPETFFPAPSEPADAAVALCRTCEVQGKVVYLHSGSGLGIFGMGVLIEKVPAEGSKPAIEEKTWEVTIPVAHATCVDNIEISPELLRSQRGPVKANGKDVYPDYTKIYAEWRNGLLPLVQGLNGTTTDSGRCDLKAWQAAEEAGRIGLYLQIPRAAIKDLPESIHIIRTTT